jgi:hypothetical protein
VLTNRRVRTCPLGLDRGLLQQQLSRAHARSLLLDELLQLSGIPDATRKRQGMWFMDGRSTGCCVSSPPPESSASTRVVVWSSGRLVAQAKHNLAIGSLQHDTNRANNILMQGDVTDLVQLRQIKQSLSNNPPEFMVVVNLIHVFDIHCQGRRRRRRRNRTRARRSHKDHLQYESTPPALLYIMREGYFTSISTVHFARFSCDYETGYDFDISASMSAQATVESRIDREEREFRRPPKKRQSLLASVCRLFI